MADLRTERAGKPLRVIESRDPEALLAPGLCHFRIGRNTDPESKISDFETVMMTGFGERADIAFFKFCYVDIDARSDVARIFRAYSDAMSRLRERYKPVRFVHVTVPVVAECNGGIAAIRRLLGKSGGQREDNAARGRFNEMVAQEYLGSEAVFDLASIEAGPLPRNRGSAPSARRPTGPLAAGFTDDGCHLNGTGRRVVADALLTFLSNLAAEEVAAT